MYGNNIKVYSLKNQAYNTMLLIIVTMLYIRSTDLIAGICILWPTSKNMDTSQSRVSSLCRGHAGLLYTAPVFVYVLPKRAPCVYIFFSFNRKCAFTLFHLIFTQKYSRCFYIMQFSLPGQKSVCTSLFSFHPNSQNAMDFWGIYLYFLSIYPRFKRI